MRAARWGTSVGRGVAATFLLGVAVACYDYDPVPHGAPAPGAEITTTLTDAGSLDLARYLGPDVAAVSGRVERVNADNLVISASRVRTSNGVEHFWTGETVLLPRPDIGNVAVRKLAVARSALCVALGAGGVYELLQAFGVVGGASDVTTSPLPVAR